MHKQQVIITKTNNMHLQHQLRTTWDHQVEVQDLDLVEIMTIDVNNGDGMMDVRGVVVGIAVV
jgi:hypothetical protein